MIMMLKSGSGQNFLITANLLLRQRKLGTNIVSKKRVDCITKPLKTHFSMPVQFTRGTIAVTQRCNFFIKPLYSGNP